MEITSDMLEDFIAGLHQSYKPKTVKRKIASVKALFHYLEYKEIIDRNPFHKIHVKFRESAILPKTIPLHTVEHFLSAIYNHHAEAKTECQKKNTLRDIAVIELLFATGMRISELCSLKITDVNLYDRSILIYGKGSKERKIQIGNDDVRHPCPGRIQGSLLARNAVLRPLFCKSVRQNAFRPVCAQDDQ